MTTAAAKSSRSRSAVGQFVYKYGPAVIIFFVGLLLWELAVRIFDIKGFLLPKPTGIATAFVDEIGFIYGAAWVTLREALGGFVIGSLLGVAMALVTSRWRLVREGALPLAIAVNSAPILALAPIFNAWFGSTNPMSKMAVVAVMVFFPVMINMVRGLTTIDARELELMRSYAATDTETLRKVRIPSSLPYLFNGLKIGAVLSMIGAIVAEYFGGPAKALGVYILQQAAGTRLENAWSGIIVGTAIGITLYLTIVAIERVVMPWHVSVRENR